MIYSLSFWLHASPIFTEKFYKIISKNSSQQMVLNILKKIHICSRIYTTFLGNGFERQSKVISRSFYLNSCISISPKDSSIIH